jgi:hypothetical protein
MVKGWGKEPSADLVGFTGDTRHRVTWRGKLVLQIQEIFELRPSGASVTGRWPKVTQWRDAREDDMAFLSRFPFTGDL